MIKRLLGTSAIGITAVIRRLVSGKHPGGLRRYGRSMEERSLRSAALGIIAIARQFGVRITADTIDSAIERGNLNNRDELENAFSALGVTAQLRRVKPRELRDKSYYYPCVALLKDGTSRIVTNCTTDENHLPAFICIDPLDPSAASETVGESEFLADWSGLLFLVAKRSGQEAQDRFFDWRWFLPELFRYKWLLLITAVASIIIHLIGLAPIIFIQVTLDKVLGYGATSTLYILTFAVILALIFGGILTYSRDYTINFIATSVEARLSGDLFDKIIALPSQTFQTTPTSELESTMQAASNFRMFISRQILGTVFDSIGILIFAPILIGYSPILALIAFSFAVLSGLISLYGKMRERELGKDVGQAEGARARIMRESITGIETIKTFSLEGNQRRDWRQVSSQSINRNIKRSVLNNIIGSLSSTLQQSMTICVVFVGVILVMGGNLSAGAIISSNMLAGKIVAPIKQLFTFFADLDGFRRNLELVAKTWNGSSERGTAGAQHVIRGEIAFRNVTVNFNDHKALDSLSLIVPARGKVAIVGPSAAGKTTMLRMIQGLLYPNTGVMEVDGHNFRGLDINNYRNQVATVDANPVFFTCSIEENLRWVRPNISDREIEEALNLSGLSKIIKDLPDGLSTEISQNGAPLSQGTRTCLAIARCLISQPRVLLLDEALTTLDKSSQVWLIENLDEIARGRTLIMSTHDLRFTAGFDSIIVLESGVLAGQGTHHELLANCPIYEQLWNLDLSLSRTGRSVKPRKVKLGST